METKKEPVEIGVRYCGGCNPTYDRAGAVRKLQSFLPEFRFVNAQRGVHYKAAVIVNGCLSACTSVLDLAVPADRQVHIGGFKDLVQARDQLRELLVEKGVMTLNREQVEAILPHRPPMLFVDEVTRLAPGSEAAAVLFLDPEWDLFRGHFPSEPVFPGVLAVEAMAQTADLMVMTQECYKGKTPLLMEIGRVRFLRKFLPGMTAELHAVRKEERRDLGIVICVCQIMTEGRLCAEAEITLAMR